MIKLPSKPVTVEKCQCGHSHCSKYAISWGTFYNGAGWSQEEARFIADAINEKIEREKKPA